MKRLLLSLFLSISLLSSFAEDSIRIQFITPSIVRVTASACKDFPSNETGVCVYPQKEVDVKKTIVDSDVRYESSELIVTVFSLDYTVLIQDKEENDILTQGQIIYHPSYQERVVYDENSAHTEETANGKVTVKDVIRRDTIGKSTWYATSFYSEGEKALYGLGCQMEDYMNLKGKELWLTQHNLKVQVPMLLSTNGYGLLFDAGCSMQYKNELTKLPCGHGDPFHLTWISFENAKSLDYYFIKGENLDSIVAGYRYLTGNVSMMPRYLFGYTQSKERYTSSDEIVSTLKEYRRRHVPIDMIVQDWNYWPQGWGYMKMDSRYYPSPKALADSVHSLNAKLMVSIWPNPQWCPEADDFKSKGMMLEHDIYDVFNPEACKLYWKYANDEFYSNGFDAWWCDSSEPLDGDWNRIPATDRDGKPYGWNSHKTRWELNSQVLSESLGAERSSLYSLYHSKGIYENQRQQDISNASSLPGGENGAKRVVNLTRSSYAGQQRYGTIVWNGDTHASWESFRQQIPAGLNYMATGNPYWTVDVGSFFTKDDGRRWFYKGEFPEGVRSDAYKEYYVRMFQWATFLPMLRSHGSDTPREIWQFGEPGTKYYDAILKMINLRYQHVPYIYSMAAAQSHGSYSMARMLAFDFAEDTTVLDIKDEYMFGDYLVCPVTHPLSETTMRKVYLPDGYSWTDYWSGKSYEGGQWIDYNLTAQEDASATSLTQKPDRKGDNSSLTGLGNGQDGAVKSFPLFVRSGSIIPTTEVAEYTDAQVGKPVTISIYPGKDAEFTLYEDEGNNYNYEKGAYSLIPLRWNESNHTLTIGERTGSYNGMAQKRTFIIKTIDSYKKVTYKGKEIHIKL